MSDSNECSICLSGFDKPKGLPCFHTFCHECLQMYINKYKKKILARAVDDRYFLCPFCRAKTTPSDPERPITEWAASFPTNNYVLNSPKTYCSTHQNEPLDVHCKSCKIVICCRCCFSTHETCEKTLTKINAKKIKKNLHAGLQHFEDQAGHLEKRLCMLEEVKEATGGKIRLLSEELSVFIKKQEKQWLEEVEATHLKESGPLQERKDNLEGIIKNIKENIEDIGSLIGDEQDDAHSVATFDYRPKCSPVKPGTDFDPSNTERVNFEINPAFVKIKDEILKENMMEKEIIEVPALPENNGACEDSKKSHQVFFPPEDETAEDVSNETEEPAVTNIPELAVAETLEPAVCCTAESGPIPQPLSFTTDVSFGSYCFYGVNDMVLLPDKCVLINLSYKKTLFKFSSTGNYMTERKYSDSEPFGLCLLRDNSVALSLPQSKKVTILDCDNLSENDSFSFGKTYKGLASDDGEKLFCLYRDNHMYVDIVSKNNPQSAYEIMCFAMLPSSIYACDNYRLRVLPSSGHLVIINSTNSLNVACFDQSGNVVFKYEGDSDSHKLSFISDVAVSENFLFVADKTANKIHRIQHDGTFVDVPLTENDGISSPTKIFVNAEGELAILIDIKRDAKIKCFI